MPDLTSEMKKGYKAEIILIEWSMINVVKCNLT